MPQRSRITRDARVMGGKPGIRGMQEVDKLKITMKGGLAGMLSAAMKDDGWLAGHEWSEEAARPRTASTGA